MHADEMVRHDIIAELSYDPRLIGARIEVSVAGGAATLTGQVENYQQKIAAEKAAQRVRGVRTVAADLRVAPASQEKPDDKEIAKRIANVLAWNAGIPETVKAVVDQGWVTLEGEVGWDYQRRNAERAVLGLGGVAAVSNNIVVKSGAAPTDIRARIEAALVRSAKIDAHAIEVAVSGSVVTLSGKVAALNESESAERAAWAAPGVTEVRNKLSLA